MRNFTEEIEQDFAYHILDEASQRECAAIMAMYLNLSRDLVVRCPSGRHLALALTKLKESMDWATSAISVTYPKEQ